MILDETYTLSNGVEIPKLGLGTWFIANGNAACGGEVLANAGGAASEPLYAHGRRAHPGGRSRRNRSTFAYACLQSEVAFATLAPWRAASSDAG
jgi:hypothetical protein